MPSRRPKTTTGKAAVTPLPGSTATAARAFKRDVVKTGQFGSDAKRGKHRATFRADLQAIVNKLADDVPLPPANADHPLAGNWKSHRDCHIKPDLVLIYRKTEPPKTKPPKTPERPKLHLVRVGSHSELGI